MTQEYFTPKQCADLIGLSGPTVFYHLERGNLRSERWGRYWIISRTCLDLFIEQRKSGRFATQGRPRKQIWKRRKRTPVRIRLSRSNQPSLIPKAQIEIPVCLSTPLHQQPACQPQSGCLRSFTSPSSTISSRSARSGQFFKSLEEFDYEHYPQRSPVDLALRVTSRKRPCAYPQRTRSRIARRDPQAGIEPGDHGCRKPNAQAVLGDQRNFNQQQNKTGCSTVRRAKQNKNEY